MPEFLKPLSEEFDSIRLCEPTVESMVEAIRSAPGSATGPNEPVERANRVRETFDWKHRLAVFDSVLAPDPVGRSVR
jgi:hypothetical protein